MDGLDGVITAIAPDDTMHEAGKTDEYFRVGRGALDKCKAILDGRPVKTLIDFPSGYGRALRWFKREWPDATTYAVETDVRALDFVQATFEALPIVADAKLEMEIPAGADLIFSGSLLTHFDDWQWDRFLSMCVDALAPDGTFVFTTHGRIAALMAEQRHPVYGELIDTRALFERYSREGFAFLPYSPDYPEFGLSLSSPSWIMRRLERLPFAKIIAFEEYGWGQDVVAVRKHPWPLTIA